MESFSRSGWRSLNTQCLLKATDAIDELCHTIVTAKASFAGDNVAAEIRKIALTVAVFERSLYAYALRIRQARESPKAQPKEGWSSVTATDSKTPASPPPPTPNIGVRDASSNVTSLPVAYPIHIRKHRRKSTKTSSDFGVSLLPNCSRPRSTSEDPSGDLVSPTSLSTIGTDSTKRHNEELSEDSSQTQFPVFFNSPSLSHASSSAPSVPTPLFANSPHIFDPSALPILPNPQFTSSRSRAIDQTSLSMPHPDMIPVVPSLDGSRDSSTTSLILPVTSFSSLSPSASVPSKRIDESSPSPSTPVPEFKHPGGMFSLLTMLTRQLQATRAVLMQLTEECSSLSHFLRSQIHPRYRTSRSISKTVVISLFLLFSFRSHVKSWLVRIFSSGRRRSVIVNTFFIFIKALSDRLSAALAALLPSFVYSPLHQAVASSVSTSSIPAPKPDLSSVFKLFKYWINLIYSFIHPDASNGEASSGRLMHSRNLVDIELASTWETISVWSLKYMLVPFLLLFAWYRYTVRSRLSILRRLHSRLGVLLRLWHICISIMDQNEKLARGQSETEVVPISSWMLQLVPPSLDASFWYKTNFRLWFLKLSFDVLYCSTSFWYSNFGGRTVVLPIVVLAAFYYAIQPKYTARCCSELMGVPLPAASFALKNSSSSDALYSSSTSLISKINLLVPPLSIGLANSPSTLTLSSSSSSLSATSSSLSVVHSAWALFDCPPARFAVNVVFPFLGLAPHIKTMRMLHIYEDLLTDHLTIHSINCKNRPIIAQLFSSPFSLSHSSGDPSQKRHLLPSTSFDARSLHKSGDSKTESPKNSTVETRRSLQSKGSSSFHQGAEIFEGHSLRVLLLASKEAPFFCSSKSPQTTERTLVKPSVYTTALSSIQQAKDATPSKDLSDVTNPRPSITYRQPVIVYLHGGGFIEDFRSSHMVFLKEWAVSTAVPIFYVDFSLAPEQQYPTALNECMDFYRWLVNGRLGFRPTSITLVGDSSGGNLATAMCIRAIMEKIKIPDGLVLAYPILNLQHSPVPTPSRALFMMDALLPMNLLLECRASYLSKFSDPSTDPCLSPVVAPDELLCHFPPTSIMVGALDPFLDDSVDFVHRLDENHVKCRLQVYDSLPHSFLDFGPLLPEAREAIQLAARWLKEYSF